MMLHHALLLLAASVAVHCDYISREDIIREGVADLLYLNKMSRAAAQAMTNLNAESVVSGQPDNYLDIQNPLESVPPFACNPEESPRTPEPPTSVHQLRPTDIKVVAAFGDSVTAGIALGDVHVVIDVFPNRGEAWSIGGDWSYDKNVVTIPNILRKFGNDVKGQSGCYSQIYSRHSWYNLARPDATNEDIVVQTNMFLDRLFNDSQVDPANDWKLLTIMIGDSDICKSCHDFTGEYKPETYRKNIEAALDKLYATVPRMFVNLVAPFPVSLFNDVVDINGTLININATSIEFNGTTIEINATSINYCDYMQLELCDCGKDPLKRDEVRQLQLAYYQQLEELVNSGKYDGREDFAVVLQPHLRDMVDPPRNATTGEIDKSFYAADCVHFSRKGHMALAYMLWNTMLTPVGHKSYSYNFEEEPKLLRCPTEQHQYLFTRKNSNVQWP